MMLSKQHVLGLSGSATVEYENLYDHHTESAAV